MELAPVLAAALLVPALAGCLAGSAPDARPAGALSDASPSPGLNVTEVEAELVGPNRAAVTFRLQGPDNTRARVTYGNATVGNASSGWKQGSGGHMVVLDRLLSNASYEVTVEAQAGNRTASREIGFRTPARTRMWAKGDAVRVRPGIRYRDSQSNATVSCTLGFIATDRRSDDVYALTAGHCVDGIERVYLEDGWTFLGDVEAVEFSEGPYEDWALIRIQEGLLGNVSPSVAHWSGPTGVSPPGVQMETLCYYGHGEDDDGLSRRHRCGKFRGYHESRGPDRATWHDRAVEHDENPPVRFGGGTGGDSGGPVLDYDTGRAVGIHVRGRTSLGGSWSEAMTVYDVLDAARDRGFYLKLATARYDPPPDDHF